MNQISFVEFLQEKHSDQYQGLDDQMPDDFEDWLQGQDVLDVIEYAERWKSKVLGDLGYKLSDKEKSLLEVVTK